MPESQLLLDLSLKIGQLMLQKASTEQLMVSCCQIITDSHLFNSAWIGLLSNDQTHFKTVRFAQTSQCKEPSADFHREPSAGFHKEPFNKQPSTALLNDSLPSFILNHSLQSLGIAGRSILENQFFTLNFIHKEASPGNITAFEPWQELFNMNAIQSVIVLPLSHILSSGPIGCLMVTSDREGCFSNDNLLTLQVVSSNVSQLIEFKDNISINNTASVALQQERIFLDNLINSIPFLIFYKDLQGVYIGVNTSFEKFFGKKEAQIIGKTDFDLFDSETAEAFREQDQKMLLSKTKRSNEEWIEYPGGEKVLLETTKSPVLDENNEVLGLIGISRDITQQKQAEVLLKENEAKLEHLANFDQLTHLPNRNLFLERFEQTLNEARRFNKGIAVIFMDLDNFKYINDTFGHEIGDVLLVKVAERLSRALRKYDLISRFGGDEFVVALPYLDNEKPVAPFVEKLKSAFERPFELKGQSTYITCSMGVSLYPDSGDSAGSLLKFADMAMYKAKEKGRNQFHFFNEEINHKVNQQIELSGELKSALVNNEFTLLYQPQIELSSGDIVACEALLRWDNKKLGHISPHDFIPVAEQSRFINEIDLWVLDKIQEHLNDWSHSGKQPVRIFANFSERGFSDIIFLSKLKEFIKQHFSIACYLGIELTEPVLLKTSEQTTQTLSLLHENGISLALDQFGEGYSSMRYLKNSPIDRIKISRKFISKAVSNGHEASYLNAIIAMAQALNIKTVAMGIESQSQKVLVEQTACELAQGYIYYQPMSAAQLKDFLKSTSG